MFQTHSKNTMYIKHEKYRGHFNSNIKKNPVFHLQNFWEQKSDNVKDGFPQNQIQYRLLPFQYLRSIAFKNSCPCS